MFYMKTPLIFNNVPTNSKNTSGKDIKVGKKNMECRKIAKLFQILLYQNKLK